MRWPGLRVLALLIALGGAAGCGEPAPREPIPDPASLTVPDPDLGEMEKALQDWLQGVREEVSRRAGTPEAEPAAAGRAFGELGQLYHIFDLPDAAEICYDNARRLLPEEYRWTYLLGLVRMEKGDLEQAERDLEHALELRPESLAAWIRLGDARLELARPEDARTAYEKALELAPEPAAALFGLGRAEAALDRPEAAVSRFEEALRLQPQASVIRYPLAQAYRKLGRLDEAAEELARRGNRRVDFPDPPVDELSDIQTLTAFQVLQSLAADVEGASTQQLLGFAVTHLGKVRGTVEQLETVLEQRAVQPGIDPRELARLHYATGALLVNEGSDARAAGHFRTAVELDPSFTDAHVKLGNALARGGHLDRAVEEFSRALELDPGDRDLRVKRATALLNLRRGAEAMIELRALVAEDPGDPTARIRVAEALEATGAAEAAQREYRAALAADLEAPALARIHRAHAAFLRRQGRFEAAVEEYERALERDQNLVGARSELAALLGHLGRFPEAASHYARVVSSKPENEEARLGEVTALILDRRLGAAVERLEEGVSVLPGSVSLSHLLARLLAAAPGAELRRGNRALELAMSAYEARPVPPHAETVAMAYAELGRYEEAVEWQRRVLVQLGEGAGSTPAQERLSLYRARRPFRLGSAGDLLGAPGD